VMETVAAVVEETAPGFRGQRTTRRRQGSESAVVADGATVEVPTPAAVAAHLRLWLRDTAAATEPLIASVLDSVSSLADLAHLESLLLTVLHEAADTPTAAGPGAAAAAAAAATAAMSASGSVGRHAGVPGLSLWSLIFGRAFQARARTLVERTVERAVEQVSTRLTTALADDALLVSEASFANWMWSESVAGGVAIESVTAGLTPTVYQVVDALESRFRLLLADVQPFLRVEAARGNGAPGTALSSFSSTSLQEAVAAVLTPALHGTLRDALMQQVSADVDANPELAAATVLFLGRLAVLLRASESVATALAGTSEATASALAARTGPVGTGGEASPSLRDYKSRLGGVVAAAAMFAAELRARAAGASLRAAVRDAERCPGAALRRSWVKWSEEGADSDATLVLPRGPSSAAVSFVLGGANVASEVGLVIPESVRIIARAHSEEALAVYQELVEAQTERTTPLSREAVVQALVDARFIVHAFGGRDRGTDGPCHDKEGAALLADAADGQFAPRAVADLLAGSATDADQWRRRSIALTSKLAALLDPIDLAFYDARIHAIVRDTAHASRAILAALGTAGVTEGSGGDGGDGGGEAAATPRGTLHLDEDAAAVAVAAPVARFPQLPVGADPDTTPGATTSTPFDAAAADAFLARTPGLVALQTAAATTTTVVAAADNAAGERANTPPLGLEGEVGSDAWIEQLYSSLSPGEDATASPVASPFRSSGASGLSSPYASGASGLRQGSFLQNTKKVLDWFV